MGLSGLALWALLAAVPGPVQCPPWPGDPPWRGITCRILSRMGQAPDRPEWPSRVEPVPIEPGQPVGPDAIAAVPEPAA